MSSKHLIICLSDRIIAIVEKCSIRIRLSVIIQIATVCLHARQLAFHGNQTTAQMFIVHDIDITCTIYINFQSLEMGSATEFVTNRKPAVSIRTSFRWLHGPLVHRRVAFERIFVAGCRLVFHVLRDAPRFFHHIRVCPGSALVEQMSSESRTKLNTVSDSECQSNRMQPNNESLYSN